ncbi:hypothetical protein SAMN05421788_101553 [Filimonas lacunae]|uniref:DUF5675 domain-containing protein n=1 Tax=Filimonas lacunae TaxID=477680 RepID=A0A173MP07_9BACT|nr:DUF5675 family protein [Filimonas lacunae]BAV09108.1 hypothetical protein FLA_5156 [Filimonas lacunae]SIS67399.1 hypothetical protein SAMN05421788_101553 [Filimonas lacunae]
MEIKIHRTYHKQGTNGRLEIDGKPFCFTIELPWKENESQISCIPEGTYPLAKRFKVERGHHLLVQEVKGRSLILIHPANNALNELRGCIAPVSTLTGAGRGESSRAVFLPLVKLVNAALDKEEAVTLVIVKSE